ncbi:MAG: type II secretion system protein [Lentisphaerae bacterium]|nr:type II secretion system protein [Lentisphaerota bacterium]
MNGRDYSRRADVVAAGESPVRGSRRGESGMSLIEVLLAAAILGFGLSALMAQMSGGFRLLKAAKDFEDAQWILSVGELKHPLRPKDDIEEDLTVEADSLDGELPDDLTGKGFTYERVVDEKEDPPDNVADDGLYVVRTRVNWFGHTEEFVRYVWKKPQ